jgi:hypothetical protein
MGHIAAQYVSRVLIDHGVQTYFVHTTGRRNTRTFAERLCTFVRAVLVPEGGPTAMDPVRPEFRGEYDRLMALLGCSPEGVLRQLRDLGFLATELNAPHHELLSLTHAPGFYVAGRHFPNDMVAVIALLCVALQRACTFPAVHVLTRDDRIALHVSDGTLEAAPL